MRIEKKVLQEYFNKIKSGEKSFEIRLADWPCKAGDVLVLKELDKSVGKYTGRKMEKNVRYVSKTKDMDFYSEKEIEEFGFQIIGFD